MKSTYKVLAPFIILFTLITSCETEKEYLIPESKMIEILIDIHIADGLLNSESFPYDHVELRPENVYKNVLAKHQINRLFFDSALTQYTEDRELYVAIYEIVIEELRLKQSLVEAEGNEKKESYEGENFYYSFTTDYETNNGLNKTIQSKLTDNISNSGLKSYEVKGDVYPQSYEGILSNPVEEIEFEAKCFLKFEKVLDKYPTLAFILVKDGKIISSEYVKINKFIDKQTSWKEIKVKAKLSLKTPESSVKVNTYFFNKDKKHFYIDDYSIKIKQLK